MKATVKTGNLFASDAKYIVHQCNCVSQKSAHLAKDMFQRFRYADVYTGRQTPDKLGTIAIRGDGESQRYVINMFGQYFPGRCKYPNGSKDNPQLREKAFADYLKEIEKIGDLNSIAFPWGIGCGAAGGDWAKYQSMIDDFAYRVWPAEVSIIKLPE